MTFNIAGDKNFLRWKCDVLPYNNSTGYSYVNVFSKYKFTSQVLNKKGKLGTFSGGYPFSDSGDTRSFWA